MRYRIVGELRVSAVGLGAMPLSIEGRPDEGRAMATVHAALDAGVTLLDTADSYHLPGDEPGHNERLVARALATYGGDTADVLVTTKGASRPGTIRDSAGAADLELAPEEVARLDAAVGS